MPTIASAAKSPKDGPLTQAGTHFDRHPRFVRDLPPTLPGRLTVVITLAESERSRVADPEHKHQAATIAGRETAVLCDEVPWAIRVLGVEEGGDGSS